MSGPSLQKQDAHTLIHEAALNEAKELTLLFRKCLAEKELEKASHVAEIIIEHWESRTLKHADDEEDGLYKDAIRENPKLTKLVFQLTRDHDLMRRLVSQIKEKLIADDEIYSLARLMDALIIIDEFHNEDEMNKLLSSMESKKPKIDEENKDEEAS